MPSLDREIQEVVEVWMVPVMSIPCMHEEVLPAVHAERGRKGITDTPRHSAVRQRPQPRATVRMSACDDMGEKKFVNMEI